MSRVARENLWNEVISHEVASYADGVRKHLAEAAREEKVAARVSARGRRPLSAWSRPVVLPPYRSRPPTTHRSSARSGPPSWLAANRRREIASDIELCSTSGRRQRSRGS